jgi:adenylylsulfate kinase
MASKDNNSRRTIAVDFDGVIADYDGYKGPSVLGQPRSDVREALVLLRAEGWKIVIHTTRGSEEVEEYLRQHAIPHDEINSNSDYQTQGVKPVADVYWDDRAVCYSGDARSDINRIRSFRTWSGRE